MDFILLLTHSLQMDNQKYCERDFNDVLRSLRYSIFAIVLFAKRSLCVCVCVLGGEEGLSTLSPLMDKFSYCVKCTKIHRSLLFPLPSVLL